MNAKSARLAHRSPGRKARMQRPAAARFALTVMLGTISAFLWVLPTAQAESVGDRSATAGMIARAMPAAAMQAAVMPAADVPLPQIPQMPVTMAANARFTRRWAPQRLPAASRWWAATRGRTARGRSASRAP
jgi:pilus assembly protein CpaC